MRGVLILAGVMIGLGTVMAQVADHMMAASATTAPSVMLAATESPASGVRSVVVPRDRHGHFQTEGRIEGQRVKFMVDTGASVVAMNETSAARIGVRPARGEFNVKVTTANGVIKAARTRLAMVQIGDRWNLNGLDGPPIRFLDARTGHGIKLAFIDAETGELASSAQLRPVPGSGADALMQWRLIRGARLVE